MSQDLFAAFGPAEPIEASSSSNGTPQRDRWSAGLVRDVETRGSSLPESLEASHIGEDDDDFGDFEDGSSTLGAPVAAQNKSEPKTPPGAPASRKAEVTTKAPETSASTVGRHPFAGHMDFLFAADDEEEYDAGADDLGDLSNNPEAAVAYSKRVIAAQQEEQARAKPLSNVQTQQPRSPNKLKKKSGYAPATKDPNVLFDAEEVSENEHDDDFGGFESGATTAQHGIDVTSHGRTEHATSSTLPALDLLGLDESPARILTTNATATGGPRQQNTMPVSQNHEAEDKADPPNPQLEDDAWDDFEESAAQVKPPVPTKDPSVSASTRATSTKPTKPAPTPSPSTDTPLPPTNIPPPATLLSIFPPLITSAQEALFTPLSKLDLKQRQTLLAHPATHTFFKGYLGLSIVLGRIIAGRKLRWKRDQYLAQGMRIGPAVAGGGKGGMKLAGVDKAELAKEEREALDAVRVWRAQVGKLRGAVAAAAGATAGGVMAKLPAVPEIAEQIPVKALKPAEGGLTAAHACALCGLRREERVSKVDGEVDDSFGEWWVEGMSMHLLCRNFWEEHRVKLRSR